jgi:hypothetical protein
MERRFWHHSRRACARQAQTKATTATQFLEVTMSFLTIVQRAGRKGRDKERRFHVRRWRHIILGLAVVWQAAGSMPHTDIQEATAAPSGIDVNALKLNKRGWMDTDVSMSEFANGPHTVSAWLMPKFVNAFPGDVLASTSNLQYHVGLGDYRSGNGDANTLGDPVLTITIGSKTVMYLAPGFSKRTWHHFVMRRTPATHGVTTFQLFVDGHHRYPSVVTKNDANHNDTYDPGEIAFSLADPLPIFSGKLRVGSHVGSIDYFYGLVDTEVLPIPNRLAMADLLSPPA